MGAVINSLGDSVMSFETMRFLPDFLMPDAQPGDWYQWVVVAAGHASIGVAAMVSLRVLPVRSAMTLCLSLYLMLEAAQLAVGGDLVDGATDALFVIGGMVMAAGARSGSVRQFDGAALAMMIAAAAGAWLRM